MQYLRIGTVVPGKTYIMFIRIWLQNCSGMIRGHIPQDNYWYVTLDLGILFGEYA